MSEYNKALDDVLSFINSDVKPLIMHGITPRELVTHLEFGINTMKEGYYERDEKRD